MHKLIIIYQENKNRIGYFLKLFRLGKKESLTPERIIQLVKVADNIHKLQEKLQQLQSEIVDIEMKKSKDKEQLKTLQNEIEATQEKLNLVNKTFNMKYELKEACSQAQKLQNSVERFKEGQDYQELDRMELTPFTTTTIINYNSFLALRRPLPYPQGNEQLVGGRVLEMVERILYNLQNA
jgi:DNA repair exonuclease SbcCD ATPase subunit